MARKKSITKRRRLLFIEKLQASGSVTKASIAGEIGRSSWYDLRDRDEIFKQEWDDAEASWCDDLEAVALSRAVVGVTKEVPYTHFDKDGGKETAFNSINTKSDRLLELCLKARHPAYKPIKALELSSPDGSMKPRTPDDVNWDNLSDEEVEQLVDLQRKLHAIDKR